MSDLPDDPHAEEDVEAGNPSDYEGGMDSGVEQEQQADYGEGDMGTEEDQSQDMGDRGDDSFAQDEQGPRSVMDDSRHVGYHPDEGDDHGASAADMDESGHPGGDEGDHGEPAPVGGGGGDSLPDAMDSGEELVQRIRDGDMSDMSGTEEEESPDEMYDSPRENPEQAKSHLDIQQAMMEREHLKQVNEERQRKIVEILERDKLSKRNQAEEKMATNQAAGSAEPVKMQYLKTLDQVAFMWEQIDRRRREVEEKIDKLTAKLDREHMRSKELSDSFLAFKREVAVESRFSRTGQPIPLKRVLAFEAGEEARDKEVSEVRLRYINLQNQIKQLEEAMKQREEVEGLHLIDFEQLKIENQTLNEKIEERNDELHKLRKKTTTTVQVLTHIKEKLQFVEKENASLEVNKTSLDQEVSGLRDKLTRLKHTRDQLRSENATLKQKQGFIGSDMLVGDFERRKSEVERVRGGVETLHKRYTRLSKLVQRADVLSKTQPLMPQKTVVMPAIRR